MSLACKYIRDGREIKRFFFSLRCLSLVILWCGAPLTTKLSCDGFSLQCWAGRLYFQRTTADISRTCGRLLSGNLSWTTRNRISKGASFYSWCVAATPAMKQSFFEKRLNTARRQTHPGVEKALNSCACFQHNLRNVHLSLSACVLEEVSLLWEPPCSTKTESQF